MRIIKLLTALATLTLMATGTEARAQTGGVAGNYDVTVKSVANSCKQGALELDQTSALTVATDVKDITLDISGAPELRGPLRNRGRFKASGKTKSKAGKSVTKGNFSATGRAKDGSIRLVLVAEFFKDGTALCTQSWNIVGNRR